MDNSTLGKRISSHRKRMGMTQEQLAERIGVTPQAVSKWENDISCPDISVLPELAEIFGISVDELFGKQAKTDPQVHHADVVDNASEHAHCKHKKTISGIRWGGIWFAVYVLCIGGLMLTNNLFDCHASVWSIIWKSAILFIGLAGISHKFSFFSICLSLAGAYFLLAEFSIIKHMVGWGTILPIFLIIWGASLLLDVLLNKHAKISVDCGPNSKSHYDYTCNDGYLDCDLAFGSHRVVVATQLLRGGKIDSCFGEFVIDFSGCEALAPNCHIDIDNSFGKLSLLVPDRFCVDFAREDSAAASKTVKGQHAEVTQGTLILDCDLSFGAFEVRYV